jgi:hypothetical protein
VAVCNGGSAGGGEGPRRMQISLRVQDGDGGGDRPDRQALEEKTAVADLADKLAESSSIRSKNV